MLNRPNITTTRSRPHWHDAYNGARDRRRAAECYDYRGSHYVAGGGLGAGHQSRRACNTGRAGGRWRGGGIACLLLICRWNSCSRSQAKSPDRVEPLPWFSRPTYHPRRRSRAGRPRALAHRAARSRHRSARPAENRAWLDALSSLARTSTRASVPSRHNGLAATPVARRSDEGPRPHRRSHRARSRSRNSRRAWGCRRFMPRASSHARKPGLAPHAWRNQMRLSTRRLRGRCARGSSVTEGRGGERNSPIKVIFTRPFSKRAFSACPARGRWAVGVPAGCALQEGANIAATNPQRNVQAHSHPPALSLAVTGGHLEKPPPRQHLQRTSPPGAAADNHSR